MNDRRNIVIDLKEKFMIKRSYRKALNNLFFNFPDISAFNGKVDNTITFTNKAIFNFVSIPFGYHKCPRCESQKVLRSDRERKRHLILQSQGTENFVIRICGVCNAAGFIDYCKKARSNFDKDRDKPFLFPVYLFQKPKFVISSIILYCLYFQKNNLNIESSFNFRHLPKFKYLKEFKIYFLKYKNERDKRKQFLSNNFASIRSAFKNITKVKTLPKRALLCWRCNSDPFDIEHCYYEDIIKLKLCANCLGYGYNHNKRDAKANFDYIFDLDNGSYNSKEKTLKNILSCAELNRDALTFEIGRMQHRDQKK